MLLYTALIFVAVVPHQFIAAVDEECPGTFCIAEKQYCDGKSCVDHSKCLEDEDCLNKSNYWSQDDCIGPITCEISRYAKGGPGYCSKSCDEFCETDRQCGDQQYCGDGEYGVCLDHTTCRGDGHCLDPSNDWVPPKCIGPIVCQDGSCTRNCSVCATDEECGEEQYCGANVCRDYSKCQQDVDCHNPSNMWGQIECIGFNKCEDGVCRRTCGYPCEGKIEAVKCFASPCETTECDGKSCVDDYCGGCNAIVFDWAGNEVCTRGIDDKTLLSSSSGSDMQSMSEPEDPSKSEADRTFYKLLAATLCLSIFHFTQFTTA